MKYLLIVVALLVGCGGHNEDHIAVKTHKSQLVESQPEEIKRFVITSYGKFRAGYNENIREILIIKDTETDIEYLTITGAGTTELHRKQTGKVTRTVEE